VVGGVAAVDRVDVEAGVSGEEGGVAGEGGERSGGPLEGGLLGDAGGGYVG